MQKPVIVFGLDDLNPLHKNSRELEMLLDLCKDFPKIKITHFVPANYLFREQSFFRKTLKKILLFAGLNPKPVLRLQEKSHTLLSLHSEWFKELKKIKQFSFEMHGFHHIDFKTGSAMEFFNKNFFETKNLIYGSEKEFLKTGLSKPKVFAPPGWFVSKNVLKVLKQKNMCIAGNMYYGPIKNYSFKCSGLIADPLSPSIVSNVLNIPRNWDIFLHDKDRARQIIDKSGFLGLHGHMQNIGVKNGITKKSIENIVFLLEFLEKFYSDSKFFFFRDAFKKFKEKTKK